MKRKQLVPLEMFSVPLYSPCEGNWKMVQFNDFLLPSSTSLRIEDKILRMLLFSTICMWVDFLYTSRSVHFPSAGERMVDFVFLVITLDIGHFSYQSNMLSIYCFMKSIHPLRNTDALHSSIPPCRLQRI